MAEVEPECTQPQGQDPAQPDHVDSIEHLDGVRAGKPAGNDGHLVAVGSEILSALPHADVSPCCRGVTAVTGHEEENAKSDPPRLVSCDRWGRLLQHPPGLD